MGSKKRQKRDKKWKKAPNESQCSTRAMLFQNEDKMQCIYMRFIHIHINANTQANINIAQMSNEVVNRVYCEFAQRHEEKYRRFLLHRIYDAL